MTRVALVLVALAGAAAAAVYAAEPDWYLRARYPLRYEHIVRGHAENYRLDPALVAAVIYQESKFRVDARSESGAVGLMQLLPETAKGIAARTGGSRFTVDDLLDPEINVRYGSWYLRHLLDKYGTEERALAAYNGGQGNVDRGVIYPETEHYVERVLELRSVYRRAYGSQLGALVSFAAKSAPRLASSRCRGAPTRHLTDASRDVIVTSCRWHSFSSRSKATSTGSPPWGTTLSPRRPTA